MSGIRLWPDGQPMMVDVLTDGHEAGGLFVKHRVFDELDDLQARMTALSGRGRRGVDTVGDLHAQVWDATGMFGGTLWMSDTANERCDHQGALDAATGHVLVGGLGLGLFALAAMVKQGVDHVTVVEINPNVIELVEGPIRAAASMMVKSPATLTVINDNIKTWTPKRGVKFDTVWIDIWPTLCTDDLEEHKALKRKFSRRKSAGAFFGCWGNSFLRRMRRMGY